MKNEGECRRSAFAPVPSPVLTRGSEPKATNDKGGPAQPLKETLNENTRNNSR